MSVRPWQVSKWRDQKLRLELIEGFLTEKKNMANVRVISSSLVQAANHSADSKRIELTPWDLQLLSIGYIQKGLLFPRPQVPLQDKETENTLIRGLQTSLARTLDYFPPLAGHLATTEHENDTISFFIDCNNAGALFVHAASDGVTISDIINPVYVPPIVHSFFPLNGLKNYEGIRNPLLGIQVTDLVDGIFIGCTFNHSVADGASFWHFLNSWPEISKGSINLSRPPVLQRWFPHGTDIPIRFPRSIVNVKQSNEELECILIPPSLQERIFHFSKENIAKLKAKANAEMGTQNISSLQALLSLIWRFIIRNRRLDPDEVIMCHVAVGARQRLRELLENYFGNALLGVIVTMKAKELLEQVIGKTALKLNGGIATMTEESFKKFLESWPKSPKLVTMSEVRNNVFLVVSSSPRFNMYGNDFGWGKPIAVRSGSANKFDGKITLFCGAEEGSIDVEVCLYPETLEALANDKEFMDIVNV